MCLSVRVFVVWHRFRSFHQQIKVLLVIWLFFCSCRHRHWSLLAMVFAIYFVVVVVVFILSLFSLTHSLCCECEKTFTHTTPSNWRSTQNVKEMAKCVRTIHDDRYFSFCFKFKYFIDGSCWILCHLCSISQVVYTGAPIQPLQSNYLFILKHRHNDFCCFSNVIF